MFQQIIMTIKRKKSTRAASDKQEKKVAKDLGGRQTVNSGATPFQKGDVLLEEWLVECKTKMKNVTQITIKKEWIEKNGQEARQMGKPYHCLAVDFGGGETYYVIGEDDMKRFMQYDNNGGQSI